MDERRKGFTFIELLSALALGSFFVVGTLWLYQGVGKSHLTAERQMENMQSFIAARKLISNTVGGGHFCQLADRKNNHTDRDEIWADIPSGGLEVYPAGQENPDLKAIGKSYGKRDAHSDVLLIRAVSLPVAVIKEHEPTTKRFVISKGIGIRQGGLAVVCDHRDATLLQIDSSRGTGVGYRVPESVLEGCKEGEANCGVPRFKAGAIVAVYSPSIFYVGRSRSGDGLSLYRQLSYIRTVDGIKTTGLRTEEVVENVARLKAELLVLEADELKFSYSASSATVVGVAVDLSLPGGANMDSNETQYSFFLATQNL